MIEVVLNDRLGKKVRVKCNEEDDTIGNLKKQACCSPDLNQSRQNSNPQVVHHLQGLKDYKIHDGMGLELYYYN